MGVVFATIPPTPEAEPASELLALAARDLSNAITLHSTLLWSALALAVLFLLAWARRALLRAERRSIQRHALACDDRAGDLLASLGFEILGRQVRTSFLVAVDGDPLEVELRADYVVFFEGRRFVAEVKSGRLAPRIETAATRRQLLEYRFAFDVDGVLLVDAETSRVSEITFHFEG